MGRGAGGPTRALRTTVLGALLSLGLAIAGQPRATAQTPDTSYYVMILTNVASPGNIFIGQLSAVDGKRTCDFTDGGLCADAGGGDTPVKYSKQLGPFDDCAKAFDAYNQAAQTAAPGQTPHPAFGGLKVYIFGGSYFIDNQNRWCSPASGAPTPSRALTIDKVALDSVTSPGTSFAFGDWHLLEVHVVGQGPGATLDPATVNPVDVSVQLDGVEFGSGRTNATGYAALSPLNFPDAQVPSGRTHHTLTITASKDGFAAAQRSFGIFITRDLSEITIAYQIPHTGPFTPGDTIDVKGQIWSLASGLWIDPVPAHVVLREAYGGGVVAQADSDEHGFFTLPVLASDSGAAALIGVQTFIVHATPQARGRYLEAEITIRVPILVKDTLSITAISDRAAYDEGDLVTVTGVVTARSGPVAAQVGMTVDSAAPLTVATDANGAFRYQFAPQSNPSGYHVVYAVPHKTGYHDGPGVSVFFGVRRTDANCQAGEVFITQTSGPEPPKITNPNIPGTDKLPGASVAAGFQLAQGLLIETEASRLVLQFRFGPKATASVAINEFSKVYVARYCRDASGTIVVRLQALIRTGGVGQVLVDIPPVVSGGAAPLDLRIDTQTVSVTDKHTRYLVTVDQSGTTDVAALKGAALVKDPTGKATAEVAEGRVIDVKAGTDVANAPQGVVYGKVDPDLTALLGAQLQTPLPPAQSSPQQAGTGSSLAPVVALVGGGVLLAVVAVIVWRRQRLRRSGVPPPPPSWEP